MGFCRNLAALNPNVRLTLFLSAVGGLADSLWSGTVLAAYLYEIDGDRNARVGYVEAASGLATLVTALPVGWAADKLGRGFVVILPEASIALHRHIWLRREHVA